MNAEQVVIDVIANDKATSILENIRGKLVEIEMRSQSLASAFNNITTASNNVSKSTSSNVSKTSQQTTSSGSQTKLSDFDQPTVKPKTDASNITREIQSRLDGFKGKVNVGVKDAKIDTSGIDNAVTKGSNFGNTVAQASQTASDGVNNVSKSLTNASKNATSFGDSTKKSLSIGVSAFHNFNTILTTVGSQFQNMSVQIAGLFGAAGLSGMIEKMWKGAAERQTNMLYLMHQKGVKQANEYYNEIMNIVTELPGDDTFLTNILNMASAMDKNIKVDNLKALGSAITDYYIASTMKGELPFETERDIRKYVTTGETRGLRNSLLANEIDMLKNKNSVLERSEALQKALEKTGFKGMSEYESATNELEEFKGHFGKAFADLGTIITAVTQPLLKFYNTLDTIFGSRISQLIIIIGTAFIFLFSAIGTTMVFTTIVLRNFELLGGALATFSTVTSAANAEFGIFNTLLVMAIGEENALKIATDGNVAAKFREMKATYSGIIAKRLNITVNEGESFSLWSIVTASLANIKVKVVKAGLTLKNIILGTTEAEVELSKTLIEYSSLGVAITKTDLEVAESIVLGNKIRIKILDRLETIKTIVADTGHIFIKLLKGKASWSETKAELRSTLATKSHSLVVIMDTLAESKRILKEAYGIIVKIAKVIWTWLTTGATFASAMASQFDAVAKELEAGATLSAAIATAILEAELAPLVLVVLILVGVVLVLVIAVEKIGEAFGLWKDGGEMVKKVIGELIKIIFPFIGIIEMLGEAFGWWNDTWSMFDAIGDGLNRLWEAFMNSDIVQGVIQYFGDFIDTIKDLFGSIMQILGAIFGWEGDGSTFDFVEMLINMFGKVGDAIMWVWNMLDDFSNSPLGFITWLNPITILLFHLDEIGSFLEDFRDALDRVFESDEFKAMVDEFNQAISELQEPFQEIWDLINEIMALFGEAFADPEGQGTEDRINGLVGMLKGFVMIIRTLVIPTIRAVAFVIRIVLTPIKLVLMGINAITNAVRQATQMVNVFAIAWEILTLPMKVVQFVLQGIGELILRVSNAIKNSIIGKILGWDKQDNQNENAQMETSRQNLYGEMQNSVAQSNMNGITKSQVLGELNKQSMNGENINNVKNLGQTYNNTNNQRQVVINNNFSEGSMPIDARNMTKKEARKMFVGAFGYRRAVGSNGILR